VTGRPRQRLGVRAGCRRPDLGRLVAFKIYQHFHRPERQLSNAHAEPIRRSRMLCGSTRSRLNCPNTFTSDPKGPL
jgi:hypothetical protein